MIDFVDIFTGGKEAGRSSTTGAAVAAEQSGF
jgi:hypothetical protein